MKKILICISGMSPQVITETLFALKDTPDFPDEVHVISTIVGLEYVEKNILAPDTGALFRLCREYDLVIPTFGLDQLHPIKMAGVKLADIRSALDHQCVADEILRLVQDYTALIDTQVHISLAGGRKTMSFFAGYVMSLLGRTQDKLSHVLVDSAFENLPEFYFPTRLSESISSQDGMVLDASLAQVELAWIPFVRLRALLPEKEISNIGSYQQLVDKTQPIFTPLSIECNQADLTVTVGEVVIRFDRLNFTWYLWLLCRAYEKKPPVGPLENSVAIDAVGKVFGNFYGTIWGESGDPRTMALLETNGIDSNFIRERKSKINGKFSEKLGPVKAKQVGLGDYGRNKLSIYLNLDSKNLISLSVANLISDVYT